MYNIKPFLSKIANVGISLFLINHGSDPTTASFIGTALEGAVLGFSKTEKCLHDRYHAILSEGIQTSATQMNLEIENSSIDKMVDSLFCMDNCYKYLEHASDEIFINDLISIFSDFDIPYLEQNIEVNRFASIMLQAVNTRIENDSGLTIMSILYNVRSNADNIAIVISQNNRIINYLFNETKTAFSNNRKVELIRKWNDELFLHKGQKVRLCNLYLQPQYRFLQSSAVQKDNFIWEFINSDTESFMLVLGNPGLGKSSLFCHWANVFSSFNNAIFIRMRDLDVTIALQSLLSAIKVYLKCNINDLENRIIFLDGYDELRVDNKHYDLFLDMVPEIRAINNLKVVMSSRENYIDIDKLEFAKDFPNIVVIELVPFKKKQMLEYIDNYQNIVGTDKYELYKQFENLNIDFNVFGIPFILYLVCSSDSINIKSVRNLYDIYSKVFAFNGGLYDRIYEGDNRLEYNSKRKNELIAVSREIAYLMFQENNLSLNLESANNLLVDKFPSRVNDYAIGNYYEIDHNTISFVHKTFQEYFLCAYIVKRLEEIFNTYISTKNKDSLSKEILDLFQCQNYLYKRLEEEIIYHIHSNNLIKPEYVSIFDDNIANIFDSYFTKYDAKPETVYNLRYYKYQNCFLSICKIANIIIGNSWCKNLSNNKSFILYLKTKQYVNIDISGLNITNEDLSGIYFRRNISFSSFNHNNMCRIDIRKSHIANCEFKEITLNSTFAIKANFNNTKFYTVDFSLVNLEKSRFENCVFNDSLFDVTKMNSAFLRKSKLNRVQVLNTNFFYTILRKVDLINVTFDSSILQETCFEAVSFEKVVFSNCIFNNVKIINERFISVTLKNCLVDGIAISFAHNSEVKELFNNK